MNLLQHALQACELWLDPPDLDAFSLFPQLHEYWVKELARRKEHARGKIGRAKNESARNSN